MSTLSQQLKRATDYAVIAAKDWKVRKEILKKTKITTPAGKANGFWFVPLGRKLVWMDRK